MIDNLLIEFIEFLQNNDVELYNEAGLQHELGFFLRQNLQIEYKIQLERKIKAILGNKKGFCKKEIDIFISNGDAKFAIELKVPVSHHVPKRMELAFNDIRFLEQLKAKWF